MQDLKDNNERVLITDKRLARLKALMKQKGVGAQALLSGRNDVPERLYGHTIEHWRAGRAKSATRGHLSYVFNTLRTVEPRVPVTDKRLARLKALMKQKGVGSKALLSGRDDVPERLKYHIIEHWRAGRAKSATRGHLSYVFNALHSLPDKRGQTKKVQPSVVTGGAEPLSANMP